MNVIFERRTSYDESQKKQLIIIKIIIIVIMIIVIMTIIIIFAIVLQVLRYQPFAK